MNCYPTKCQLLLLLLSFLIGCTEDEKLGSESPEIGTLKPSQVSENGATFNAKLFYKGKSPILKYGFVWGKNENPNLENAYRKIIDKKLQHDHFSLSINSNHQNGILYYIRAFVQTENYTIYGENVTFISKGSGESPAPSITSINPSSGSWGDSLTIKGENFSHIKNQNQVTIEGIEAGFKLLDESTIKTIIPPNVNKKSFNVSVSTYGNQVNSPSPIELLPPTFKGIINKIFTYGETITITGSGFNPTRNLNKVLIDGIQNKVLATDSNSISFTYSGKNSLFQSKVELQTGPFILDLGQFSPSGLSKENKKNINWFFGNQAGLNFSSGNPVQLSGGKTSATNGTSVASDEQGNLLFYTDGNTVWNSSQEILENGEGLDGYKGEGSQQVIIVPRPNTSNFFIFTLSDNPDYHNLLYHEVDMSTAKGKVILKNKLITKGGALNFPKLVPKISAVRHANNKDYWIVAQAAEWNRFYTFLINESGINPDPVMSEGWKVDKIAPGQMAFSPDGKKLAVTSNYLDSDIEPHIQLFKFDNSNGKLYEGLGFYPWGGHKPTGIAFSPNGQNLFLCLKNQNICGSTNSSIYQFQLEDWEANTLRDTYKNIGGFVGEGGQLQLAPDGKIYLANKNPNCQESSFLSVINQPNKVGKEVGFQHNSISLGLNSAWTGLPNLVQSDLKIWFKHIQN